MKNRIKIKEEPRELTTENNCQHYWVIDDASGPTSRGICKFCGAEKEFQNSWPGSSANAQDARVFNLPNLLDDESDSEPADLALKVKNADL